MAAPKSSKIIDTVVEVGKHAELKRFNRRTSEIITEAKISIISSKEKSSGKSMPFLATSIIPEEKVAPKNTPMEATAIIRYSGAILVPTAEFKKLAASLLTPTKRSKVAKSSSITTKIKTIISNIYFSLKAHTLHPYHRWILANKPSKKRRQH